MLVNHVTPASNTLFNIVNHHYLSLSSAHRADSNEDEDEYIDRTYKADNKDDAELDVDSEYEDEDQSVDERDTFDLDCDDEAADDFFASDAFNAVVERLGDDERPLLPRPSDRAPTRNSNTDDLPPEKPDVSAMEDDVAAMALKAYRVERKRWTDRRARQRRHAERNVDMDILHYSGDCTPMLRMMTEVQQRRLMVGDSFQAKDTLRMRIAEEANLRNKEITIVRSDAMQLVVVGVDFYVKANNTERRGWVVTTAICREGDGIVPTNASTRKIKWLGRDVGDSVGDSVGNDDSSRSEDSKFVLSVYILQATFTHF